MEELINPCSMRELTNTCKLVLPVSARIYVYGAGKNGKAGLARTIPKRDKTGQNGKESEVHLPDVAMVVRAD